MAGWAAAPDYKAAFLNTLGANAEFYGKFADNARAWHERGQEAVLFVNHALVNPPIDRNKPVEQVKDVYITIQKETDAGIYVSGAKVVATNSALTHYNFLGQNMGQESTIRSMVVMFIAPMNTPGIKLICRPSYEMAAAATGSPWDYPLTSRFDENDAIFVFDNAFIPWENVFIHRDIERLKAVLSALRLLQRLHHAGLHAACREARFHRRACSTRPRARRASRRSAACRRRSAR